MVDLEILVFQVSLDLVDSPECKGRQVIQDSRVFQVSPGKVELLDKMAQ